MSRWLWLARVAYAHHARGFRDGQDAYQCPAWSLDENNRNFALYLVHTKAANRRYIALIAV